MLSMKVDIRLPEKGNSKSHGARPVHLIITMIKWIRTRRLSIKNSLSPQRVHRVRQGQAEGEDQRDFARNDETRGSGLRISGVGSSSSSLISLQVPEGP